MYKTSLVYNYRIQYIHIQKLNLKTYKSVRRLVLLSVKKCFDVWLDECGRRQKNVIEVAVQELGAKVRLCVLHFGE